MAAQATMGRTDLFVSGWDISPEDVQIARASEDGESICLGSGQFGKVRVARGNRVSKASWTAHSLKLRWKRTSASCCPGDSIQGPDTIMRNAPDGHICAISQHRHPRRPAPPPLNDALQVAPAGHTLLSGWPFSGKESSGCLLVGCTAVCRAPSQNDTHAHTPIRVTRQWVGVELGRLLMLSHNVTSTAACAASASHETPYNKQVVALSPCQVAAIHAKKMSKVTRRSAICPFT